MKQESPAFGHGECQGVWPMYVHYPCIFTKTRDKKDVVLVEIPNFKNAVTEGYGMKDAIYQAKYLIKQYCDEMNGEYPIPSDTNNIDATKYTFYNEGKTIVQLVTVDLDDELEPEDFE